MSTFINKFGDAVSHMFQGPSAYMDGKIIPKPKSLSVDPGHNEVYLNWSDRSMEHMQHNMKDGDKFVRVMK